MTARTRLAVLAGVIIISAAYALLVKKDPQVAAAIASGYVAISLTIFLLVHVWRKP